MFVADQQKINHEVLNADMHTDVHRRKQEDGYMWTDRMTVHLFTMQFFHEWGKKIEGQHRDAKNNIK